MNIAKAIVGLISLLVTLPIWFYLIYKILESVNASELTWFLFWVYVPLTLLANLVAKMASDK